MSASGSEWTKESERGTYWAMRCMVILYRYGGHLLVYPVLILVVSYFFITRARTRRYSREYLLKVAQYTGKFEIKDVNIILIWRHYMSFARALLYRVRAWMGNVSLQDVRFDEREELMVQQQSGQGSVILGAHFGNMELCRAVVTQSKHLTMNVVMNTRHAAKFQRLLKSANSNIDVNLITTQSINPSTAIELKEKLERGESLVLLADRVAEGSDQRKIPVEFLGEATALPEGVFRFAMRLEFPIYFITCIRKGKGFKIIFKLLATGDRSGSRSERTKKLVADYLEVLTDLCREAPLEWFNFYDYWAVGKTLQREK